MHLADTFIQSYSGYTFFCQYVCTLGIEPTTFYVVNTMLYHWATGTLRRLRMGLLMKVKVFVQLVW